MMRFFYLYKRDIIALFLLILAFWGLTYTADWEGYQLNYDGKVDYRDSLITYLSALSLSQGLDFRSFYRIQCILLSLIYVLAIRRLNANSLVMVVVLVLLDYVPVANQIRYYLAFPLSIIALYELILKKRIVLYLLLSTLAILSHSSIILLHLSFGSMFVIHKYFPRYKYLLLIISNICVFYIIQSNLIEIDEKYHNYFFQVASLKGGIYNSLTFILALCLIIRRKALLDRYKQNTELLNFLFILTTSVYLFFLSGMTYQIISNRLLGAMLPYTIIYLLYSDKELGLNNHKEVYYLVLFSLLHTFVLPDLLGLYPHIKNELVLMLSTYKL